MFYFQLQILSFLSFLFNLSIIAFGGKFPTPNSPVQVDLNNNYHVATPNSPLSAVKLPTFVSPFSHVNIIATVAIIIVTVLNIIVYELLQLHEAKLGENVSIQSPLASEQLLRRFSFPVIVSATRNFDDSKVVGKGGFGKIYKGVIDDGAITVAIKRLNHTSKQGAKEFLNEIQLLSKFRHRNLISLIGYCDDSDEMILVYEYMESGSLADHLYKIDKSANNPALSWVQRLKICIGAARGLEYLHTGTNIIHRDLKSSNILLDENLTAKVSDFGISRVGPTNQLLSHVSTKVKGTRGYVDPEYLLTSKLTQKSDVYSFGVVLFEVLSGRPVVDLTRPEEQWGLVFWAQHCIKEKTIDKLTDPSLSCQILPNSLESFVKIANHCLHYRSKKRPTMAEVVASLESALALQERTDSSIFDRDLLILGANFGNQEIEDYSPKQHEVVQSGIDGWTLDYQENPDDSTVQGEVNSTAGNGGNEVEVIDDNVLSGDARNSQSRVKRDRIMPFKRIRRFFFRKSQVDSVNETSNLGAPRHDFGTVMAATNNFSLKLDESNLGSPQYDFDTVKAATDNFSHKLDEGGFGVVYKGVLPNGQEIAVKMFSSDLAESEFRNRISLVAKLQHRNLVRLLGFCSKGTERLLVYEFVPNSSLDNFIYDPLKRERLLEWEQCRKIIIGVSRGILYLHEGSPKRIIHRDLKPKHILLDSEMSPKISGFGLAMSLEWGESEVSTNICGTTGYIAPDFFRTSLVSVKLDVFSFGILVLEIISGCRAYYGNSEGIFKELRIYALRNWREGRYWNIIGPHMSLSGSEVTQEIKRCIHIALLCTQENEADRPTMSSVVLMLNNPSLPLPELSKRISFADDVSIFGLGVESKNTLH